MESSQSCWVVENKQFGVNKEEFREDLSLRRIQTDMMNDDSRVQDFTIDEESSCHSLDSSVDEARTRERKRENSLALDTKLKISLSNFARQHTMKNVLATQQKLK